LLIGAETDRGLVLKQSLAGKTIMSSKAKHRVLSLAVLLAPPQAIVGLLSDRHNQIIITADVLGFLFTDGL